MKPAVHKKWLYWICGFLWLGVGLMLCTRAFLWVKEAEKFWGWGLFLVSLSGSYFMGRFFLVRIARRNLKRLEEKPERICCFAFQPWRSYFLVGLMIIMGLGLRRSDLPRLWLAAVYALMGGALIFASTIYFLRGVEIFKQ